MVSSIGQLEKLTVKADPGPGWEERVREKSRIPLMALARGKGLESCITCAHGLVNFSCGSVATNS